MSKPSFVVQLTDLERGPKSVEWTVPEAWLRAALADTEATPRADGYLEVELTKDGSKVMVRGHARAQVSMPCARTLEPVDVDVAAEIFLLLLPAPLPASHATAAAPPRSKSRGERPERGQKGGTFSDRRRPHPKSGAKSGPARKLWTEDPELNERDAATDTYSGDSVVLDDFVREFIVLELPMFPVRQDLPSAPGPAIAAPHSDAGEERPIDPRLMPLAAIASRLRQNKE